MTRAAAINLTKNLTVGTIILTGLYDVVVIAFFGPKASISNFVLENFQVDMAPVPVLMIGMVIGHLFWPQYRSRG